MKICKVEYCDRPSRTNKLCVMHYSRFRRTGSVQNGRPWDSMTIEERFWMKVQKTDGCWIWTGAAQPSGHGVFRDENKKTASAYRWLWERERGPVPAGLVLDHIVCDNPRCVNPDHLKTATIGENVLRGQSESAKHARKTHCKRGHELSGDNLRINYRAPRGGKIERVCRTCERERRRKATN